MSDTVGYPNHEKRLKTDRPRKAVERSIGTCLLPEDEADVAQGDLR